MSDRPRLLPLLRSCPLALLLLPLAAGCGGGGGGSDSGATATSVELLVGDAPVDDLSSFELTLTGLFLTEQGGGETQNLLTAARSVDLLALVTRSALLEVHAAPAGTYESARFAFDDASLVARDLAGAPVVVTPTASGAAADFAAPLTIATGERARVHFELPLAGTLTDDLANPGQLIWTPALLVTDRRGEEEPLDEVHGVVAREFPDDSRLRIALQDRDTDARHGELTLRLSPATVLLDDDGDPFATERAFFAFTRSSDRIEASGVLAADGLFDADLVHVERDTGGGNDDVARLHGTVTDLDLAGDALTLRIRNVAFGKSVVDPVLAGLGDPAEIEISYAGAEIKLRGADPRGGDETDLAVGQTVKIDFTTFVSEPFPAHEVEIEDEQAEYEGTLVDASGLPGSCVIHLEPHDPAVVAGLVDSSTTDVDVLLDGSERLWLHLRGEPEIDVGLLADGLRVKVRGDLSGSSSAPTLTASSIRVEPGELRGTVTSVNQSIGTFVVDVDSLDDSFGGAPLPDPVTFRLDAAAFFSGDATDASSFFALFAALGSGESLDVRVAGIADGLGGALTWSIEANVVD